MARVIVVARCAQCPWNTWDYRRAEFRCCHKGLDAHLPGQTATSAPPDACPLPEAQTIMLVPAKPNLTAAAAQDVAARAMSGAEVFASVHGEHCPVGQFRCALYLAMAGNVGACGHPSLGWPVEPGNEMPSRCPCVPESAPET